MKQSDSEEIIFGCKDSSGNVVQISGRVVVCPFMLSDFSKPLWDTNPFSSSFQTRPWQTGDWSWINKGEILTELNINIKAGSWFRKKFVNVPIKSPVSGLIINPMVDFDNANICKDGFFNNQPMYGNTVKILIPTYESVPDNATFMYEDFCDFCLNNRHLFLKQEYPWFNEESLLHAVSRQRNAPIRILSFINDFGEEYLEEAIRKVNEK